MKNAKVNSLKVFCCNRTMRESTLAKLDAVERNGYELIPHPAYSPNLAPIPKLEKGYLWTSIPV